MQSSLAHALRFAKPTHFTLAHEYEFSNDSGTWIAAPHRPCQTRAPFVPKFAVAIVELTDIPDLLALAAQLPQRYPALLQSSEAHAGAGASKIGRWDLLAIVDDDRADQVLASQSGTAFFESLRTAYMQARLDTSPASTLPFQSGWVVYLGYEMAAQVEPSLQLNPPAYEFPAAIAIRTPAVLAVDRLARRAYLSYEAGFDHLRDKVLADLHALAQQARPVPPRRFEVQLSEDAPEHFLHGVARIHEYLLAGDTFQVNLSRGWRAEIDPNVSAAQIYANLRLANPAPFSALLQYGDLAVISSSPERLVELRDGQVQTRPIAGTLPRHGELSPEAAQAFIGDFKERAEHIMLIDLERNDLGRVCTTGSVHVDELLCIESYAHVHHLVSNVRGTLAPGMDPIDVLKAMFPGGTITGCPKVRCMEIIAELEQVGRGPYTGALGYIDLTGAMDFNILIRTIAKTGATLHFRAGAGIVSDSIAEKELNETRAKAKGMLRALQL